MNREEMFALARGRSRRTTEMKAKHCVDSRDLSATVQSASFRSVYKAGNHLPRSKFPLDVLSGRNTAQAPPLIKGFGREVLIEKMSGYLSGSGWRSSIGRRGCR